MLYWTVLASFLMQIQCSTALWYEFELISTENSNSGFVTTNFRVLRMNKTSFAVKGKFEFSDNLEDKYDCEVKLYSSPNGNNQFSLMPLKIPRGLCCSLMENVYWRSIQEEINKHSDMPKKNPDERLCFSYKKGKYTVDGLGFDQKLIPKYASTGTYKAEILIYQKDVIDASSKYAVIARLY